MHIGPSRLSFKGKLRKAVYVVTPMEKKSTNTFQLSLEGEVNSGGYIYRDAKPSQIRWIKKCRFINGRNFFFWNFRETTRHFFLRSQNSEYPRIFQVTGANQNARKLLSTDLVNTKRSYGEFNLQLTTLTAKLLLNHNKRKLHICKY